MALKGLTGGVYRPLSPADIETIHQAALTILEKTGISYESGLGVTIDMLDAQRNYIEALYNLLIATTDLEKALGRI